MTEKQTQRRNIMFSAFNVAFILAAFTVPRLFDIPDERGPIILALAGVVVLYALLAFVAYKLIYRNQ